LSAACSQIALDDRKRVIGDGLAKIQQRLVRRRRLRLFVLPGAALAPLELCTDNAAMIASAARYTEAVPCPDYLALDAYASN